MILRTIRMVTVTQNHRIKVCRGWPLSLRRGVLTPSEAFVDLYMYANECNRYQHEL